MRLLDWLAGTALLLASTAMAGALVDFQWVHSFDGGDGFKSQSALVVGVDGQLYGTAFGGGAIGTGDGTAFRLTLDGRLTVLHSFDGRRGGEGPAGLTATVDGAFHGVTTRGGQFLQGTVWRLDPRGGFTSVHAFRQDGRDGSTPQAPLLEAGDGALYGTTTYGGRHGWGSLFRLGRDGAVEILHSFNRDGEDGVGPAQARLTQASDGAIYGVTHGGGRHDQGTLFRWTAEGRLSVLHAFSGPDGRAPVSTLVEGPDGALYGSTAWGGAHGHGTVFRFDRQALSVLHHFAGPRGDGAQPAGDLLLALDGQLYGVTERGGRFDGGTVYRLGLDGRFSRLHSFDPADAGGCAPRAGLAEAPDGAFYGTAYQGGTHDAGGIFRIRVR